MILNNSILVFFLLNNHNEVFRSLIFDFGGVTSVEENVTVQANIILVIVPPIIGYQVEIRVQMEQLHAPITTITTHIHRFLFWADGELQP